MWDEDYPLDEPESLTITTENVCSKWGLDDGDEPDWVADHFGWEVPWHDTLDILVMRYFAPLLGDKAEWSTIITIHNPVRLHSYDGREVPWFDSSADISFVPGIEVTITPEQVVEAICDAMVMEGHSLEVGYGIE
jgi:hypothetical protein